MSVDVARMICDLATMFRNHALASRYVPQLSMIEDWVGMGSFSNLLIVPESPATNRLSPTRTSQSHSRHSSSTPV